MNSVQSRLRSSMVLTGIALLLCSCSDNTLAPFEPEIVSVTDNFQLQATDVRNRTATLIYDWENTGTQASVDHSTTTDFGTARVLIKDSAGDTVYDKLLSDSLNESTATGSSGPWEIHLVLDHYSGTLNFRVQKQ